MLRCVFVSRRSPVSSGVGASAGSKRPLAAGLPTLVGGSDFPIGGHPYADPVDYLRTVEFVTGCFRPTRIVVHHCGQPEPGAAADGLCLEHMLNLRSYYCGLGWKKGPHFDDDQCWPFTPLAMRGIINASGVGIEMLGDRDDEESWSGRGSRCSR
jgi:hypothetical protein